MGLRPLKRGPSDPVGSANVGKLYWIQQPLKALLPSVRGEG